jgi:hypothetical protein
MIAREVSVMRLLSHRRSAREKADLGGVFQWGFGLLMLAYVVVVAALGVIAR